MEVTDDMAIIMKKILTAVLSLAMVACFVPQMNAPAYAEDSGTPAIQLVQNGTAPNIPGGQGGNTESGVWFGNYKQSSDGNGGFLVEPVKWRVLANADGKLFLLSDKCLDSQIYGPNYPEMTWETSTIRAWLNGLIFQGDSTFVDNNFIDSAFSDKEQAAIAMTSVKNKTTSEYNPNPLAVIPVDGNDTEDQMFLLCAGESMNAAYGFTEDNDEPTPTRAAESTDYANNEHLPNFWWLRSRDYQNASSSLLVYPTGNIGGLYQSTTLGVRPVFNLDLSSVLFTSAPSASDGGKVSGDVGANALTTVSAYSGSEWKVTVKDGDHADFDVSKVTPGENNVTVEYKKAKTGQDEYISAIITDKPITEEGAAIKYYGRIAQAAAANSSVTINTAGKLGENDHLYVFNEQCNGDKKTDFASALTEVTIPELISYTVTFKVKNGSWNDGTKADKKVTLSRYNNEDKALVLQQGDIPKVGNKPANGYKAGSWDVTPKTDTQVTKDMTYTYTYAKKDDPSPPKPQPPKPTPSVDKAAAKIALDSGTKAISSGSKVTASWGAVKGASSYVIYANYCGQKKLKKIRTVSGKTTSFDITKLNGKKFNPKKNLKFYVVAYKTVKGKKVKLAKSIMAHAPGSKNSKRTNVTGVKVKKASFTLKKGKTAKIKAKLVLQKKNRKPLKHEAKFRYATSNKKVAKVNKKGKITAGGKGKCTVYVYAVSGVSKKVKVTVK